MPTYDYHCHKCDKVFTLILTIDEHDKEGPPKCPHCKSTDVKQVFSGVTVITSKKS